MRLSADSTACTTLNCSLERSLPLQRSQNRFVVLSRITSKSFSAAMSRMPAAPASTKSRAANRSNGDACAEFVTPRQMIMSSVSGNGWLNIERNISAFAPSMSGTSPLIQTPRLFAEICRRNSAAAVTHSKLSSCFPSILTRSNIPFCERFSRHQHTTSTYRWCNLQSAHVHLRHFSIPGIICSISIFQIFYVDHTSVAMFMQCSCVTAERSPYSRLR